MVSGGSCVVANCSKEHNVRPFVRLPSYKRNLDIFNLWLQASGNKKLLNCPIKKVQAAGRFCRRHFKEDDFYPNGRLKPGVIPSLYLPAPLALSEGIDAPSRTSSMSSTRTVEPQEFYTPSPLRASRTPRQRKTPTGSTPSPQRQTEVYRRKLEFESTYKHDKSKERDEAASSTSYRIREEHDYASFTPLLSPQRSYQSFDVQEPQPGTSKEAEIDIPSSIPCESVYYQPGLLEESQPGLVKKGVSKILKRQTEEQFKDPSSKGRPSRKSPTKSKKTGQRRTTLKNIFGATKAGNLSYTAHKCYKEILRLKNQVAVTKSRAKKRLAEAEKCIKSGNLERLTKDLTPFQVRFIENQLRNVPRNPKGRTYTFEDKADAIAIWKASPKCYRLLSKLFALPSIGTLKGMLNKVPIGPGICKPIFSVLKEEVKKMRPEERVCTLVFDEMALQPHLDYDPHKDTIIGFEDDGLQRTGNVADHVSVFMLRGVYRKWKQPVAFAFCKASMSAEHIIRFYDDIVREAVHIGLNVVASVCDLGTNNVKAIRLLQERTQRRAIHAGVVVKEGVIMVDNHEIIPIFDVPHLLKALRNNLLTKDLRFYEDGKKKTAKWSHIEAAYAIDKGNNIRGMKKVTDRHIVPEKIKKMKVSLCAQIFSKTVSGFIKFCTRVEKFRNPNDIPLPIEATDTADLLDFFDDLFDSLNGGKGFSAAGKPLRGEVTENSPHYRMWLKGKIMISKMEFERRRPGDRARPPVLDGWRQTLEGFILLQRKLKDLGYSSFSPRMFNQDPLENFFGQVRQYGVRNVNPSCKSFIPYFKSLLIRNFSSYHSRFSNCENDDSLPLVTVKEFLQQSSQVNPMQTKWVAPTRINYDEINLFEKNAVGYVAGYLVHNLTYKPEFCETCRHNLQHFNEEPDEFHHKLIEAKEYNENVKRLLYVNVNLIKSLIKVYATTEILLPSVVLHSRNILTNLIEQCDTIPFDFEECPHVPTLKKQLLTSFIKLLIFAYMRKLSNIVLGKVTPENPNELESRLAVIYQRRRP